MTVGIREWARTGHLLDGADAQALEGALCQLERELAECKAERDRVVAICTHVHDRLLRGEDDMVLMRELETAWKKGGAG